MNKYLALYMAPITVLDEMMKNTTSEDMKKSMDEWKKWEAAHTDEIVDSGAPAGKNKRVTKDNDTYARNEVCGYTIVQAESHEAATKTFADNPHLEISGAYIEVVELLEME